MNTEESLALLEKGKDAWNAWAVQRQHEREALEEAESWTGSDARSDWNEETLAWHTKARADFSAHSFEQDLDLDGFVFPGDAGFGGATFKGQAGFGEATFEGEAGFGGATFKSYAGFGGATFERNAGFGGVTFERNAEFGEATFESYAWFGGSTFKSYAGFGGATFERNAGFGGATFESYAGFGGATFERKAEFGVATFKGEAGFGEATFKGEAGFGEATFESYAWFGEATFESYAGFGRATFKGEAGFGAIRADRGFSLTDAEFAAVPDFLQANFAQAPRFDNALIEAGGLRLPRTEDVKALFKGDREKAARWRALKGFAVQGHDHLREAEFFKKEVIAKRWVEDKWWHAAFWFGLLYSWFSDFGRSITRPLAWWVAGAAFFVPLYLSVHLEYLDPAQRPPSAFGWAAQHLLLRPLGLADPPALACIAGRGDPGWSALSLSARKALLFFGLDSSDKSRLNYACLYGVYPSDQAQPWQLPPRFVLEVPDRVIVMGVTQHIFSAVMFFLFLLAVRSRFRI